MKNVRVSKLMIPNSKLDFFKNVYLCIFKSSIRNDKSPTLLSPTDIFKDMPKIENRTQFRGSGKPHSILKLKYEDKDHMFATHTEG